MKKIILDTDIGYDIDDAICLAYLLERPDCELLGITTVCDDSFLRAKLASALCKVAGRNIPIYPGAGKPLLMQRLPKTVPQAVVLEKMAHDFDFQKGQAIEFLRKTIYENSGEVIILGIGPFTNLGLLFATDPDIVGLLKGLVTMGGVFLDPVAAGGMFESNTMWDPHATAIMYNAYVPMHWSIGSNVTNSLSMTAAEIREKFAKHDLLKEVLRMAEIWLESRDKVYFHDILAAAVIFEPDICTYINGTVEVELEGSAMKGMTCLKRAGYFPPWCHTVASSVNKEMFFKNLTSVFNI